jgi:hypothetical protein
LRSHIEHPDDLVELPEIECEEEVGADRPVLLLEEGR